MHSFDCTCEHRVVVNHLTEDLEPSYSTVQCTDCGEYEIDAPEFVEPELPVY